MTKAQARKQFDGSTGLFNVCWREYLRACRSDDTDAPSDVLEFLDQEASFRVNNPKSRFYIYG